MTTNGDEVNILETVLKNGFPKEFDPLLNCVNSNQDKFNLFTAITSTYWSENLHSNLIKAILDYKELGTIEVISSFLDYIGCSDFNKSVWDRLPPVVERESSTASDEGNGRVDVLLRFNKGKFVVIIENKINGAQETDKQLGKYLENYKEENILKVVYIPKMGYEDPETWPENADKDKLVVLPAYDTGDNKSLQKFFKTILQNEKLTEAQKFLFNQYIALIGIIMGITSLSDEQRNVLQEFFLNKDARDQLNKINEMWNMRGTLVFERLVSILQKDYQFTYSYVDKDRRYPVLYKNIDDNFSLYFNDQSPNIQVGFHSNRAILRKPKSQKDAIIERLSGLELAQKHELEAQTSKGKYIFWHFVNLPVDDFNTDEEAVVAFVNIAKVLLKVNMSKLTCDMKFKDELMN